MAESSTTTTDSQSQSSGGASPPSSSAPSPGCWAAHITSIVVALVVAIPIGRRLPALIDLAAKGEWKPAAFALLALGFVVAPVRTLDLVGKLASMVKGNGKQ